MLCLFVMLLIVDFSRIRNFNETGFNQNGNNDDDNNDTNEVINYDNNDDDDYRLS